MPVVTRSQVLRGLLAQDPRPTGLTASLDTPELGTVSEIPGERRVCPAAPADSALQTELENTNGLSMQDLKRPASPDATTSPPPQKQSKTNLKPTELLGQPQVFAYTRPDLCESFQYFRALQGFAHTKDKVLKGAMFAGGTNPRQHLGFTCAIVQLGGDKALNDEGIMTQAADKSEDKADVVAFKAGMNDEKPVVLLANEKSPDLQVTLPHPFCVLDWFKVTHVWSERVNGFIVCKARLEKLNMLEPAWWTPVTHQLPQPPFPRIEETKCDSCGLQSPKVYTDGWICLERTCKKFWHLKDQPAPVDMDFEPTFLQAQTPWKDESEPFPLRHCEVLKETPADANPLDTLARNSWQGMICPKCGCCNVQTKWFQWTCEHCAYEHKKAAQVVPIKAVLEEQALKDKCKKTTDEKAASVITVSTARQKKSAENECLRGYDVYQYDLAGHGSVFHFKSNLKTNEVAGGANDLFDKLQSPDPRYNPQLQRHRMRAAVVTGTLTRHASMNYGLPYKFSANLDNGNLSLKDAPETIRDTLQLLRSKASAVITEGCKFNELLAVGYLETQAMSWHDDGEYGLGPVIATLSLGSSASMEFRVKKKYLSGDLAKKLPGRSDEFVSRVKNLVESLPNKTGKTSKAKEAVVLRVKLKHGDYIVMNGRDIQVLFEHCVVPEGKVRYALTSRLIDPKTVPEACRDWGDLPEGSP